MPINDACAAGLSRVGLLAGALDPARLAKLQLGASGGSISSMGLAGVDGALLANGVAGLLGALPFDSHALSGMGQVSLVTGLMATIHRTLGVNLSSPSAAASLTEKLESMSRGGGLQLKLPQTPNLAAADLQHLTHLSSAAVALKPLRIDLFHPNGVRDLQAWLDGPSASGTLAGLENISLRTSTLSGLSRLAGVSVAAQSAHAALNLDRPPNPALPRMPSLLSQLKAGKLASLMSQLKTGQLGSLWPAISAGIFSTGTTGGQIRLPDVSQVANLNAQRARLLALQRATGLDPLDPRNSAKLSALLKSLQANGVCRAVQTAPIDGARLNGLMRLTSLNSSLETVHSGMDVDLVSREAGTKLARTIEDLRGHQQALAGGAGASGELLPALSRLAALGTAVAH